MGRSGDEVALEPHQDFRRRTDDMEAAEVVEEHVGRGIQAAQRAVQRQRRGGERPRHALREHHLHDVAGGDVVLGLLHRRLELGLAEFGARLVFRHRRLGRQMHRRMQLVGQFGETQMTLRIGIRLHRVGVGDEVELAGEVVEHRQLLGQHQQDVRRVQHVVLVLVGEALLDIADGVVAEVAGQPAGEARQPRHRRGLEACLEVGDEIQRVGQAVLLDDLAVGFHRQQMGANPEHGARRQADEGVAPEALAAHHRFEQVGIGRVGELEVHRQRRFQVAGEFAHQRDAVVALAGEVEEFLFSHGESVKK